MAKSELSNFISSRFNDVVISGHAIAVRLRRDVVGATPQQIRTAIEGISRLNPGNFRGSLDYITLGDVKCGHVKYKEIEGEKVMWIHGGGFAFGSARVYKAAAIYLARHLKCEVVLPEYRLAPEHKYPIPLNDVLSVYKELTKDGEKVSVIGDSAGGNLAAALVQTCINQDLTIPKKLVLLSPWLDLSLESASNNTNYSEFSPFDKEDTKSFGLDYSGEMDLNDPKVSPLRGSFRDFPPTHIQASKVEYLYGDTLECIEKLESAGCDYTTHFEESALHAWHLVPDFLPEASRSLNQVVDFLK